MGHGRKLTVLVDSVKKLIRRDDYKHVARILKKVHAADIAHVLANLRNTERVRLIQVLSEVDLPVAAATISELGLDLGVELLHIIPDHLLGPILQEMEPDDAALFVSSLEPEKAQKVLSQMRTEDSESVRDLLQYEAKTAGRIMNSEVFALDQDLTVAESIQTIQLRRDAAVHFYLYVIDGEGHLAGVLSLKQLLLNRPETPLRKVMRTNVISVYAETDQEEVARQVAKYNLLAIPVVDAESRLIGIITVDDVIDVIKDEATEDIFYLAGVEADDHTYSPVWSSIRKRIPWLTAYLFIGVLTAWVISLFRGTLDQFVILALFMPMVGGMGGNSGTQTMTVAVRGIGVGELTPENRRSFIWKELRGGICNGLVLGLLAGLLAGALQFAWHGEYFIGPIMFVAMWLNISLAALWGSLIPICFRALKIDPALASGIFVATLNDILGFSIFLGLGTLLLIVSRT